MLTSSYIFILTIPKLTGRESLTHSTLFLVVIKSFKHVIDQKDGCKNALREDEGQVVYTTK